MKKCSNDDYCLVDMPEKGKNILKYGPGDELLKIPFIIYADLERLLKKEQSCRYLPKKSYTQRKANYKPLGYSLSLISSFDEIKNRRKFYRRKIYAKKRFVVIKIRKANMSFIIKSEIIVITPGNLEVLLIIFSIQSI